MKKIFTTLFITSLILNLIPSDYLQAATPPSFCAQSDARVNTLQTLVNKSQNLQNTYASIATTTPPSILTKHQISWSQVSDDKIRNLDNENLTTSQHSAVHDFQKVFHKALETKRANNTSLETSYLAQRQQITQNHTRGRKEKLTARNLSLLAASKEAKLACQQGNQTNAAIAANYNAKVRQIQTNYHIVSNQESLGLSTDLNTTTAYYKKGTQQNQTIYAFEVTRGLKELKKHF